MCIIALIPQQKQISKATLKRCWENNQHGGGFMFTDGKRVHTHKEMSSFKRYWNNFIDARNKYPKSVFVCHFRISTHGKINEDNCHPFKVNDKLGFAHNGIIRNAPTSSDYSDTYMFNVSILQHLPSNFLSNKSIIALIKEYIGSGSKLAFLSHDNKYTIVNESAGQWDENGVWFSNGGYKEVKYYDRGGTRVGTYGQSWGTSAYNTSYHQSQIGYANVVTHNLNAKPKPKPIEVPSKNDWDFVDRIQNDKKIDSEVVNVAKSVIADRYAYDTKCMFCEQTLSTYIEKQNEVCYACEDAYERSWHL